VGTYNTTKPLANQNAKNIRLLDLARQCIKLRFKARLKVPNELRNAFIVPEHVRHVTLVHDGKPLLCAVAECAWPRPQYGILPCLVNDAWDG
jgi:hypothetical protein